MIDALFGSKTRVKLLHLFLNNPGKAFYVREITRLVGEQINSVRRELSNMLDVGVLKSSTKDNRLYYGVNKKYEYLTPLQMMFSDSKTVKPIADVVAKPKTKTTRSTAESSAADWRRHLKALPGARVLVAAGILVQGSASGVDILAVGDVSAQKLEKVVEKVESEIGRSLTYSRMSYDEFYYRLSVRDKFISDILSSKREVVVDKDKILK